MTQIIDRRSTYNKNKNISNRQRFIDRVKGQIKDNVNLNIQKGKLSDLAKGEKIKVRVRDTKEPKFGQDSETGINDVIVPGNDRFNKGDEIEKSSSGSGRSRRGSLDEDSIDDIVFTLTKDEFYDILFEDLELPDMVKKDIRGSTTTLPERRGYTTTGSPNNLDILRSSKNAMGRRIALKRPSKKKLKKLEEEYYAILKDFSSVDDGRLNERHDRLIELTEQIAKIKKKQKTVPYLDPIDVRYRRFDRIPKPITNAVMFCLMDVSGSMGEKEKDIAKRFFLLLYLFLTRKYEKVDIVFIRHTTHADEVDEQTFFHDPLSGGTQISSGLDLIDKIINERYNIDKTNIYISQASDGGNFSQDNSECDSIIRERLIKKIQYFAYIEIIDADLLRGMMMSQFMGEEEEGAMNLWDYYEEIQKEYENFKIKKVTDKNEIFQVFKDLFAKKVVK